MQISSLYIKKCPNCNNTFATTNISQMRMEMAKDDGKYDNEFNKDFLHITKCDNCNSFFDTRKTKVIDKQTFPVFRPYTRFDRFIKTINYILNTILITISIIVSIIFPAIGFFGLLLMAYFTYLIVKGDKLDKENIGRIGFFSLICITYYFIWINQNLYYINLLLFGVNSIFLSLILLGFKRDIEELLPSFHKLYKWYYKDIDPNEGKTKFEIKYYEANSFRSLTLQEQAEYFSILTKKKLLTILN